MSKRVLSVCVSGPWSSNIVTETSPGSVDDQIVKLLVLSVTSLNLLVPIDTRVHFYIETGGSSRRLWKN